MNNSPKCLNAFKVDSVEIENIEFDGHGEEMNSMFSIRCKCGNSIHKVFGYNWAYGYSWKNPEHEKTVFTGPIKLKCTDCGIENELFDIEKYGYNSELKLGCSSASGEGCFTQFKCEKSKTNSFNLIARFEYPSDLFDNDFTEARGHEKDLFSWFSLYGVYKTRSEIIEICEFECA